MRRGEFEAAWTLNDGLRRSAPPGGDSHLPRDVQMVWDGSPVDGRRVLVRCYHGLGDTIQFIRYARVLRPRVARLVVWTQPELIPLLASVEGVDEALPLHEGDPDVPSDVTAEIMELPYLLRTTVATIPARVPYVDVAPASLDRTSGPAVGIVWRAGDWAPDRSIPFAALDSLRQAPVTWYVLQGRPGLAERPADFGIAAGTDDLVEAARAVRGLDLLITIDSMPAHLAGALGTPVWTLLCADADWRWMERRDDSPWYPTMRLFRQDRQGDWGPVVDRVTAALAAFADAHRACGGLKAR